MAFLLGLPDLTNKIQDTWLTLFFNILFIFREGKGGRNRWKHQCVVASHHHPPLGAWPGPQPRRVHWLGIEPVTLRFIGGHSIHWATPARALVKFKFQINNKEFSNISISHQCLGYAYIKNYLLLIWNSNQAPCILYGNLTFYICGNSKFISSISDYQCPLQLGCMHVTSASLSGDLDSAVTISRLCMQHPFLLTWVKKWGRPAFFGAGKVQGGGFF